MAQHSFLIAGGGLAGAKAAQTLREEGFTGRIQIVGAERERPYERPPLSKGYLNGTAERDTIYVHGPGWYQEHEVELLLGEPSRRPRSGRPQAHPEHRHDPRLRQAAARHRLRRPAGCPAPTCMGCTTCATRRTPTRCAPR